MTQIAVVIGAGDMGVAAAYAFHKLGYNLLLVDPDKRAIERAVAKLNTFNFNIQYSFSSVDQIPDEVSAQVAVVLSCAPFYVNYKVIPWCLKHNLKYCDLGGNTAISESNQRKFLKSKSLCFTDLGLAPGYANIIAEEGYKEKMEQGETVDEVRIYVGGLPTRPQGRLKYNLVFSVEGLRNEYTGHASIIENGEVKSVSTLTDVQEVKTPFKDVTWLECFHTSGGLANTLNLMKERNVKHCSYKTLRYPGHCHLVKFMMDDLNVSPKDFDRYMQHACPKTKKDQVIIMVNVCTTIPSGGSTKIWRRELCVLHNDDWTAMQMATSWPAVAVAVCMAEGLMNDKAPILTYADVPHKQFNEKLSLLGLK